MNALTFPVGEPLAMRTDAPDLRDWAVAGAIAIGVTVAWIVAHLLLGTSAVGDNREQMRWAHAIAWGYPKHPPAPTWLLIALSALAPISLKLTYVATWLCQSVTFLCLWRIAYRSVGRDGALVALLLTTCVLYFNVRANYFNHNTAMIAACAVCAMFVQRAVVSSRRRDWVGAGLAASLAILSKYQALPLLFGIGAYLATGGRLRSIEARRGAALALAIIGVCLLPHVVWLFGHDFAPLRYASHSVAAALGPADRLQTLSIFVAQLLWRSFAAVVVALAAHHAVRRLPAPRIDRSTGDILVFAATAPFFAMVVMAVVLGSALQNHWAAQVLAFAAPATVVVWPRLATPDARRAVIKLTVVAHFALLGYLVVSERATADDAHQRTNRPFASMIDSSVNSEPVRRVGE